MRDIFPMPSGITFAGELFFGTLWIIAIGFVTLCAVSIIASLLPQRYIRTGDTITLYGGGRAGPSSHRVTVEGWGKYAAVRVGIAAIRRDVIRRDESGNWFYRYED
jgi:hypothetical protein